MSYGIYLRCPVAREAIEAEAPHLMQGGTYAQGGTTELWLNVAYSYGRHYRRVMGEEGIRAIYGMTGAESIPILEAAAAKLGVELSVTRGESVRVSRLDNDAGSGIFGGGFLISERAAAERIALSPREVGIVRALGAS